MTRLALSTLLTTMAVVAGGALRRKQLAYYSGAQSVHFRKTSDGPGRKLVFARSLRQLHPNATVDHICIDGKQVPQLYLLGAQKAGTTSMALDFFLSGVHSATKKRKELHVFDEVCGFPKIRARNESQLHGDTKAGRCTPTTLRKKRWLQYFDPCEKQGRALIDMTPLNVRMPGLPPLMRQWYGLDHTRLGFTILLREPVARLQSGFYYTMRFEKYTSFRDYVDMIFARAPAFLNGDAKDLEVDFPLDEFYRSMYGAMVRPWFNQFSPNKFAFVTMRKYMDSVQGRQNIMKSICEHFKVPADPRALTVPHRLNKGRHPALEDDLDAGTISSLNNRFFVPDAKNLSAMLVKAVNNGALLAGYTGNVGEEDIHEFLRETW